jgi:hypothetical protein
MPTYFVWLGLFSRYMEVKMGSIFSGDEIFSSLGPKVSANQSILLALAAMLNI